MLRVLLIGALLVLASAFAMPKKYKLYFEEHKLKANILEYSTGVPTSVQLAQAIIESGGGRSNIAKRAKNHFGIRKGDNWSGPTFDVFKRDPKTGELRLASSWRKYNNIGESYLDHACYLSDHYGAACGKGWRHWVKYCRGYSGPGPEYWQEVGRVIKIYKLYQYDLYK